jgi:hypothetical protein
MKTHDQIVARIEQLRVELKEANGDPQRHKRGLPGHRGNLGTRYIRTLEGEIRGLQWALDSN